MSFPLKPGSRARTAVSLDAGLQSIGPQMAPPMSALPDPNRPSADTSLSAAFRSVLGTEAGPTHLPVQPSEDRVRISQAKPLNPAPARTSTQNAPIGPRSGHK